VIFTTAYDQYTLKAFKVNSIDYLLKPIDPDELKLSMQKYDRLFGKRFNYEPQVIQNLLQHLHQPKYKERFLIKTGQQISFTATNEIQYFYSEDGMVFFRTEKGKKHTIDYTLEQLERLLDPKFFFRINRKAIIAIGSIQKIAPYFNNRLILETTPPPPFDFIISRDRVNDFKNWLDR
jgi:DNA-binding LytR/AlgR family response regulator